MKKTLSAIAAIIAATLFFHSAKAQEIVTKRYRSGEVASVETSVPWPDGQYSERFREVKVEVFNRRGELVYVGNRRNYAGHSSVHLTYHPNGGVSGIDASSAPDAGIQWYKEKLRLDEEGNIIDRTSQSHDMMVSPLHGIPRCPTYEQKERP